MAMEFGSKMEDEIKKDDCKILYSFFLDKKSEKKYKKYLNDYDTIYVNFYSYYVNFYSYIEFKMGEIIEIQLATSIYAKVKIISIKKQLLEDSVGHFFGLSYGISIIKIK